MPPRRVGAALAAAGLAAVLAATLTPVNDVRGLTQLTPITCLVCGESGGADIVANLLLFLPLAIGLRLSGLSWRRTIAACGLLSLTIELLQLWVIPGRDASLSDVLTNTTSGAAGAVIGGVLPLAIWPRPEQARRLLAAGIAVVLLLLAASAWMLSPKMPEGTLFGLWARDGAKAGQFDGQVRAVTLDGIPMPGVGAPPDSAGLRARLERGQLALAAEVVSGRPLPVPLWIYALRVPSGAALTLSQHGLQAGLAMPARSLRYRFRPLVVTLSDAFPAQPGVPVRLTAREGAGRARLTSSYGGAERSVELSFSPAYGWSLVAPLELASGTGVRRMTALLLAAAFLPLGYWAGRTGRLTAALVASAAALAAGVGALPAVTGFPPVHWSEWAGGLTGIAAGWALCRPAAYLERRCASPSDSESFSS